MKNLLVEVLREPSRALAYSDADWDLLIPQARLSQMLATLWSVLEGEGLLEQIPERPRNHCFSEWVLHQRQIASLDYEIRWLLKAVANLQVPLVVLKGGAYIQLQLPAAGGRLISDIDLMVPNARINEVENALNAAGWIGVYADEYDERYYREWMHEIPPLYHEGRESTLDVHHTIVPPTASPNTDAGKLFEELREVRPGLFVLSPVDMVIHSAVHLFHEGEFRHAFRDVFDLDRLLRGFAESEADFWEKLVPRAMELDQLKSLFYGLRYAQRIFGTPVPQEVLDQSYRGIPGKPLVPLMDFLYLRALAPDHYSCQRPFSRHARFCLYMRSHYIRMPLYLLVPHLLRKAWKRRFEKGGGEDAGEE